MLVKGKPATNIADIEKVEIVFKDGAGHDSEKLIQSVQGLVESGNWSVRGIGRPAVISFRRRQARLLRLRRASHQPRGLIPQFLYTSPLGIFVSLVSIRPHL